jgi:hypothetical protein
VQVEKEEHGRVIAQGKVKELVVMRPAVGYMHTSPSTISGANAPWTLARAFPLSFTHHMRNPSATTLAKPSLTFFQPLQQLWPDAPFLIAHPIRF